MYSNSGKSVTPRELPSKTYSDVEDLGERLSLEELNVQLDTNMNQITRMLKRRRQLIRVKEKLLMQDYIQRQENVKKARPNELAHELRGSSDKEMLSLLANLDSYAQYRNLVNNVWNQNIPNLTKMEAGKTSEFWNINKKLESQIDVNLKKLKSCDMEIDRIVNEEFETCTTIDEIEEHIRQILRKKEEDHIRKAEPYSIDKAKLLGVLQNKQVDREKVKDEKRQIIKKILGLLEALKSHREARAQAVAGLMFGAEFDLNAYQDFLNSLETIAKSRQNMAVFEDAEQQLHRDLETAAKQSRDLADIFIQKQSYEALKFAELQNNFRGRIKLIAMEKLFISDTLQEGGSRNLAELARKCQQYKKILETALNEESSIKTGLARTKQTIEVFDKILKTIESEKQRRQRLLHQLEKVQEHHSQLEKEEEKKRNMVVEVENIKNKKKQLEKHLNELVTEADVTGYKRVMEEMSQIDKEIQSKQNKYQSLEQQLVSNQHKLIDFTNSIKNDFSDILKEVVPNSWMMNHDLKKFENIFELNIYLKKTFKRLGLV